MLYIKWYLSELGSIMFIHDHVCNILWHQYINLWYCVPILIHFESCHCQKYNLSQSPSNLSQSSSIYLSHVRNWKKLEANENYWKWITMIFGRFGVNYDHVWPRWYHFVTTVHEFMILWIIFDPARVLSMPGIEFISVIFKFISVIFNLSQSCV